jgi:hypothetical protein
MDAITQVPVQLYKVTAEEVTNDLLKTPKKALDRISPKAKKQ